MASAGRRVCAGGHPVTVAARRGSPVTNRAGGLAAQACPASGAAMGIALGVRGVRGAAAAWAPWPAGGPPAIPTCRVAALLACHLVAGPQR